MRLLRSLFNWKNVTWAWQEDAARALIMDLDEHRLSGVALGDSLEELSFLGPGKVTPLGFGWPHKGVGATVYAGRIEGMGFSFGHAAEFSFVPAADRRKFAGSFQYRGAPLPLSKEVGESQVRSLIGEPYWRDQDEDEIILFYEFPNCEWQLEFDLGGSLKYLEVGEPLLADAEQRAAYAVTKPWPPNYG